jgi:thiol-disulfide isomerase/thioredoxin
MENLNEISSASAEDTMPAAAVPAASAETASNKNTNNVKIIITVLTALLVVALGALSYFIWKGQAGQVQNPSGLTPESASKVAIDYINKYFAGSGALASISDLNKEETTGLYKFTLELQGQKLNAYVSSDGKMLFPQDPIDLTKSPDTQEAKTTTTEAETKAQTTADGNFNQITDAEICQENGKPIVYFFGSESCPHCIWEKPVISAVAKKFGSAISYHENVDNGKEMDVFNKYSTGSIPTVIIGCKYYRVGSGESAGEQSETATLTKLICDITGNQPAAVCGQTSN